MPIMKAKDDGEMFDVPDNEREAALATGKFDEFYRVKAKEDGEEFIIPSHEIDAALKTGKFEFSNIYDDRKKVEANPTKPQIGKLTSAALGAGNAMSLGFADEIIGGLGGDKNEIRNLQSEGQKQNPGSYFTGSLLGGVASPSIVGSAGKTLATAVGKGIMAGGILGGVQGYGENTNPDEVLGDVAKGTLIGAGTGAIGGAIGRVAPAAIEGGRDIVSKGAKKIGLDRLGNWIEPTSDAASKSISGEIAAFKEGAKASKPDFIPGINQAKKLWDGVKETLKSADAQKEFSDFIYNNKLTDFKSVSRMVEDGSIPQDQAKAYLSFLNNLSGDEYIITKLNDGDSEVAGWVARQAGGNVEQKQKFLAMQPEDRQSLRSLDMNKEAKELAPLVDPANEAIFKDAGSKFGIAKADVAKNKFNPDVGPVLDASTKAGKNFNNMKETAGGGTLSYFKQAEKILKKGIGEVDDAFTENAGYGQVKAPERYQRLLRARQVLSDGITWSEGSNQPATGEKYLRSYREAVDKALKEMPSQVEADKAYSIASKLDEMIFKNAELKGSVDPYKLKRAFGNTDQANRLRDGLKQLQEFASNSKDPAVRENSQAFLDKFNEIFDKKQNSDALNQLQREGGPSALAIQNLQRSMRGKDGTVLQEAINETPAFMIRQEARAADMQKAIGKAYKDMTLPEKTAFNKVYIGIQKQGNAATPEAIKHNFGLELEKANKIK